MSLSAHPLSPEKLGTASGINLEVPKVRAIKKADLQGMP
jgi:hypothetical protein